MGILYENTLLGDSTWAGWSPTADGDGTGTFTLSTPSAVIITKAYLIAGCCGQPAPLTVSLFNGTTTNNLTFNSTTRIGALFQTSFQNGSGLSSVHAIDVTSLISLTATSYQLTVPPQVPAVQRYTDFVLAVEYFTGGGETTTQWFINENNMLPTNSRTLNFVDPINNALPVGVGLMTGYCCNITTNGNGQHDATNVLVNGTPLGIIGSTTGDGQCGGSGFISPLGNYRYGNSTLIAGVNCNTNQAMSGLDVLSDIKALVALNDTSYILQFNCTEATNTTNNLWAIATTYVNNIPAYENILCGGYVTPTVSNITTSGATVTWCSQGSVVNWQNRVQWRVGGATVWLQSGVLTNVSTYNITGLITNTPYEFRVVNVDADGSIRQPSAIQRFITL